jgi:hypothetical protein
MTSTLPVTTTYYSVNFCTKVNFNSGGLDWPRQGYSPTSYIYLNLPNASGVFSMVSIDSDGNPGPDSRVFVLACNQSITNYASTSGSSTNSCTVGVPQALPNGSSGYSYQFNNLDTNNYGSLSIDNSGDFYDYYFSFVGLVPSTITNTGTFSATDFITTINPNY